MKLVKQDIGVWVKVSDELPEKEDSYVVKIYQSEMKMYFNGKRFETEDYKTPSYWLKPIKQVYVLTEDELEELKIGAYSKGYELGKEYGKDPF